MSESNKNLKPGWKMVKFGDVVRQCKEKVDREENPFERYVEGGHMDSEDIHIRRWGVFGQDYVGPAFHRIFRKGQVLYGSRRTYLKKVAVAEFDGITANTTFVLETKDQNVFMQELLPFLMLTNAFTEHSIRESKGSTNPYINWSDIAKFEFPLPPIEEQKRIAEILWAADEATRSISELEAQVETAVSVLLASKFPKRTDGSQRFVSLASLCTKLPQSGIYKGEKFLGRGIKIVKMGQLFGNDLIDDSVEMEQMDLTDDEIERYRLTPNDLLFGRRSIVLEGAGKCSMVGELHTPIVFESSILRVSLDPAKAKTGYVYSWFKSPEGKKELRRIRSFTTVAGITGSDLKKVKVPLLPQSKQIEIIKILENYRVQINEIERHKKKTSNMMKAVREGMVGGAGHV